MTESVSLVTEVEDQFLNLFFDSGCGDMVIRKSAVDMLMESGQAELWASGPITYSGVGDKSLCTHGL